MTPFVKRVSTFGRVRKMYGLQANGTLFRNSKHGIWKGSTVQELKSRVTQRHPLFQILRAPIRPGHGHLSVKIGFHTFCPDAPNVGAMTPFGHPVEHMVLGFGRFEGAEKGENEQFFRLPRGTEDVAQGIEVVEMLSEGLNRQHLWNG
ncbi:hypothetical protein TNCT_141571 [Trichonephila clavata]|uniref:Uncharacterized protein n=1 Tax=Trichonephila clavata TaxID=2740835 RepID=A0A8X6JFP3_TRICU|nr:hypothetical protein TNCT_141571 [Trichonephila clavata]